VDQTIINWIFAGFGALAGFILNNIWQAMRDLQQADRVLADKVGEIEILVAGEYVKRPELTEAMRDVFALLHRIEDKLDKKADRG